MAVVRARARLLVRAHPLRTPSLRRLFTVDFSAPRGVSKKAAGSESRPRKIHRDRRHWRSRSVLTPPMEEPGTRENSSRSFPLSSRIFPPLSSASLVSFSLSLYRRRRRRRHHRDSRHLPVFFSFFVLLASSPGPT